MAPGKPESFTGMDEPETLVSSLQPRSYFSNMSAACRKAITYLAENSGVIAALTQQQIQTGSPDWALSRIPETKYDPSKGHSPRFIRVRTTPPRRVRYQPMLAQGNQTYTGVSNPVTGEPTSVIGDKTGRGCSLPAETIGYGYDSKNRCLMGKALEAGPWCILDLIEKEAFKPLLQQLWTDLPRYGKEDFGRQLLRDSIEYSHNKFSVAEGFPISTGVSHFPVEPAGGPSIGFFRKIETIMKRNGWDEGAGTPMVQGRRVIQVRMSREGIEWAIAQRKKELNMTIDTRQYVDDGIWGKTVIFEGIQFIEADLPTRGYLEQVGANSFEFVEIDPFLVVPAQGEGFWPIPNPEFDASHVYAGGARHRVVEVAHIIHPRAMERQSLGAMPSVPGKTFNRNFDFEVNPMPDWELADRGCNKDLFFFGYRMLHAYAVLPKNPELMTAVMFLSPTNQYEVVDPWVDMAAPAERPVGLAPLADPKANDCQACEADKMDGPRDPVAPESCGDDMFPQNGAGTIGFRAVALDVEEGAGNLTVVVERLGGNVGAATVDYATTAGTALAGTNFTAASGTLSWADGAYGPKSFNVPILAAAGNDDGKQFTITLSNETTAALGTKSTVTVTILDADEA